MVSEDAKREALANAFGLCRDVLKDVWSYKMGLKRKEKEKEIEKDLMEARQKSDRQRRAEQARSPKEDTVPSPDPEPPNRSEPVVENDTGGSIDKAAEALENLDERIERAKEEEMCGFCVQVLEACREAPPRLAKQALDELSRYKELEEQAEREGWSQERLEQEIEDMMDEFDAIPEIIF